MSGKLCLGTVKVGIPSYGHSINNNSDDHNALFFAATKIGITHFDTSPRYANSEKIIGNFINNYKEKISISTKIDDLSTHDKSIILKMRESVLRSIENLGCMGPIDLCYLHQNDLSIISNKYILEGMEQLKHEGLIGKSGASIYSLKELDYILESNNFDWVQIPVNILDTSFYKRIVESKSTIKVAARSVFLQGIMFNTQAIKKYINDSNKVMELLESIKSCGDEFNLKLLDIAVAYVYSLQLVDQVIIGTTNVINLKKISIASKIQLSIDVKKMIDEISSTNKPWTNPRSWNKGV